MIPLAHCTVVFDQLFDQPHSTRHSRQSANLIIPAMQQRHSKADTYLIREPITTYPHVSERTEGKETSSQIRMNCHYKVKRVPAYASWAWLERWVEHYESSAVLGDGLLGCMVSLRMSRARLSPSYHLSIYHRLEIIPRYSNSEVPFATDIPKHDQTQ